MKKKILITLACILAVIGTLCAIYYPNSEVNNVIDKAQDEVIEEIKTLELKSGDEIIEVESTEEEEKELENENVESTEIESLEQQGDIAYNGDYIIDGYTLGEYKGLTYYSQLDSRWKNIMYSSIGDSSQTIGSSACGPTSMAMVISSLKGEITPIQTCEISLKYGYRSANNGTYWAYYQFMADYFDLGYQYTSNLDTAINLLNQGYMVVASCGSGLFTYGGHYIVIYGIDGNTLKIYDPYLYSGKFDTSSRKGKVTVSGNTVYCSIDNFRNYANYKGFFGFNNTSGTVTKSNETTTTSNYTMYVKVNSRLNVRDKINGDIVDKLTNGTKVTVYETKDNWSRIGTNRWVCNDYLVSYNKNIVYEEPKKYTTGTYITTSNIHVRYGTSTKYTSKTYKQLSANARSQNKRLGNQYYNGYLKGVVCTVTKVNGAWGYTKSGWICLDYCMKK